MSGYVLCEFYKLLIRSSSYTALFPKFISIVAGESRYHPHLPWTSICTLSTGNDPDLPQILYAFFSFARGVGRAIARSLPLRSSLKLSLSLSGNIASGPISTALLNTRSALSGTAKAAYGVQGYGALIIFTGGALLASGVGAGYKGIKRD